MWCVLWLVRGRRLGARPVDWNVPPQVATWHTQREFGQVTRNKFWSLPPLRLDFLMLFTQRDLVPRPSSLGSADLFEAVWMVRPEAQSVGTGKLVFFLCICKIQWDSVLWTPAKYGHPGITDSPICPDEFKAHIFFLKLTRLIQTPDNTDTSACHCGVRINRVPLYLQCVFNSLFRLQKLMIQRCLQFLIKSNHSWTQPPRHEGRGEEEAEGRRHNLKQR